MKKLLFLVLTLAMLMVPVQAFAYEMTISDFSVYVDDVEVYMDVNPVIIDGRMLVPLRSIMESLDCDVYWDGELECIEVIYGELSMRMYIGDDTAYFETYDDYWTYPMDVPPIIVFERTMVPLRFISEALGYEVIYNESGWVDIYS